MLSYSPIDFEDEVPPPPQLPQERKPSVKPKRHLKLQTESDYVVMAFVVGTFILIISDMMSKK